MGVRQGRRGTKGNPFEVGEKVRTLYFRGAAPERERRGVVEEVDDWKGVMALSHTHVRYKVRWRDGNYDWLTSRGLESDG